MTRIDDAVFQEGHHLRMSGRLVQARSAAATFALLLVAAVGAVWVAPAARADSVRAAQWYLDVWRMDEVWKISKGAGITVAVVDSGVDATHPDLAGQVLPGPLGAGDGGGHGTGMAGLIAGLGKGNGGQGVYGVAPEAKILPFSTRLTLNVHNPELVAQSVRLAADSPARIINLSLGDVSREPKLADAVAYALSKGKLVVAAAGNTPELPKGQPIYPAAYPGVIGVSALTREGFMVSNGIPGSWVSLSSPGADTPTACISETRYCVGTGSSGAAALTSGVAALVWSVHPDWTANQVIKRLLDTANRPDEPVPSNTYGWGSVSPRKALASTDPPGPADVNPLVGKRGDAPTTAPTTPPKATQPAPGTPTAAAPNPEAPPATSAAPSIAPNTAATGGSGDDDSALLPVLVGVGGVVLLVGGLGAFALRRRRARELAAAPPWPPAPPPTYYHQQGGPYGRG